MSVYRIKQFIWAITAYFKPIDKNLIKKYLNENEQILFDKLRLEDKHHCIRVCNDAIKKTEVNKYSIDEEKLAKIALLHDIGKSYKGLNIIDKSVLVILDKFTKGNLKKYDNNKINTYYNHPKESVNLLKNTCIYDKEFLEAVEKHHYKEISSNIYLKIIKECDDQN